MIKIYPPAKPFPSYKWRWAVLTPTESLNSPPVFLGVLRVFNKYSNHSPNSQEVIDALGIVQVETKTRVNLQRSQTRNLVRNSGQYWKALGLLEEAHGVINVSPFGKLLAEGQITQVEFATTIVKTLELPNKRIENADEWEKAKLKIKPLELILDVLSFIAKKHGVSEAYITPFELLKIVIPLAGVKSLLSVHAEALIQYRSSVLDIDEWPDCAPSDNDPRMVREFLIFLANYGFCNVNQSQKGNENERYFLSSISKDEIIELHKLRLSELRLDKIVHTIRETQIPANVERKRISREILERPFQNIFRKNILSAFNNTCLITGVNMENVLEASHIIDVKYNGSDKIENGLCLRSDIHQLFDSKHLKILPDGEIVLSDLAASKNNYPKLPKHIDIPDFVNKDNLHWRITYT